LDFDDAFDWYERQRAGLGVDFVVRVQETLDQISVTPELYPQVLVGVRRALVRRYPYSIFYRIESGQIIVLAVLHGRRHPSAWQERI
jgi:plasmid stabilization system protein ParE